MSAVVSSGVERFAVEFDYQAYPHQLAFHESPARHRLLGGAAGPGKTLALIMDHMLACAEFSRQDAAQVHTLLLRRTHPKLAATLITRFREKIPRELYRDFNETHHTVTWLNGATTQFGSMQYEHDVMGWQGQWYKIGYDELTEFTFKQWNDIAAWNRCPVSPWATKDGATNPIGIGAPWVESLFVKGEPCAEMDQKQRMAFRPKDYAYFPATYLDNPIYANDPTYIANLDSYQEAISNALKHGVWGVAGGYFQGAWDEAYNVYPARSVQIERHWRRWLGGDWGFDHNSAIYWLSMDEAGIVRIYRELVVNRHTAEELAARIIAESIGPDGEREQYEHFSFSWDAFAQRQDTNPIGMRMGAVLRGAGLPSPSPSTKDKMGREQLLYDMLRQRVCVGVGPNSEAQVVAKLQISDACKELIRVIPTAPRDEDNREEIAEFLGDDPLQGVGYGLYSMFGSPAVKPFELQMREALKEITDPTSRAIHAQRLLAEHARMERPSGRLRWMRGR